MPFWSNRSLFWCFSPNQMLVCSLRFYLLWEQSSVNKPFSHSHTQLQHFWISASKCLKCESVFNFSFTLSSHLKALSIKDVPTLITDSHFWISKVITGWLLSSWYFDPFLKHHLSLTNFTGLTLHWILLYLHHISVLILGWDCHIQENPCIVTMYFLKPFSLCNHL